MKNPNLNFEWEHCNAQDYVIYSNKKETSDFYGTVSFDLFKISQQK